MTPSQTRSKYSVEYYTWKNMRRRCYCKTTPEYKYYGGKGIKVCKRWSKRITGFLNFLSDMGPRPKGLTIERINSDGDYTPSNCKWASWIEQVANRSVSKTHLVSVMLKLRQSGKTISEISGTTGASTGCVSNFINYGRNNPDYVFKSILSAREKKVTLCHSPSA